MKNFKTIHIFSALLTLALFLLPTLLFTQDPGGGPDAPIDGGLSVLLAAGAGYGVKKYRNHKRKQAGETEEQV